MIIKCSSATLSERFFKQLKNETRMELEPIGKGRFGGDKYSNDDICIDDVISVAKCFDSYAIITAAGRGVQKINTTEFNISNPFSSNYYKQETNPNFHKWLRKIGKKDFSIKIDEIVKNIEKYKSLKEYYNEIINFVYDDFDLVIDDEYH